MAQVGPGEDRRLLPARGLSGLGSVQQPRAPPRPLHFLSFFLAGSACPGKPPPVHWEPGHISIFISHLHDLGLRSMEPLAPPPSGGSPPRPPPAPARFPEAMPLKRSLSL